MPLIALVGDTRARASVNGPRRGRCVDCGGEMIARTGEVITWHWAHRHGEEDAPDCRPEPETEWHLGWKARCADADRVEVTVGARRADVLTPYRWAVEFQHSPLDVAEVRARERDWRHKLIWVVDATDAHDGERLQLWRPQDRHYWTLRWKWAPAWVRETTCRTFIDLGGGRLVLLGKWYDKSPDAPVMGYGWPLTAEQVTRCVLDGARPPRLPGWGQPLNPESWVAPVRLVDCPNCAHPLNAPPVGRCAASRYHRAAA